MAKLCENCGCKMVWNSFKKRWECKACGNAEFGDTYETDLNTPDYIG